MDKIKFNNQIDLYIDQNWNKIDKKYKHRIANTQRFKLALEYLVNIKNKNLLESIRYLYKKYQISFGLQFEKIIDEKFLPLELLQFSTKQERLEYLKGKLHKCKICGKWTSNDTYCSIKCASNDELVKNKIKMTTFKHLGVYTSSQSKEIQEKSRNTKIKKYGDPNYTNLKKRQETNLKKYGCTNALNSNEIKEKSIKTCIKKYGTNCYMKSKDFIRKSRETLRNKYGVFNNYYISKKEIDLFECLNCRKIHNDRDLIFPLELDIVLPDYKLAIEYNGV